MVKLLQLVFSVYPQFLHYHLLKSIICLFLLFYFLNYLNLSTIIISFIQMQIEVGAHVLAP